MAEFLARCSDPDECVRHKAAFFAAIQRPYGPQLLAVETGRDLETPYVLVSRAQTLEDLFGAEEDGLLAERQLIVDLGTRTLLLREVARAMVLLNARVHRNIDGDYAEDANPARFPRSCPSSLQFPQPPPQTEMPAV